MSGQPNSIGKYQVIRQLGTSNDVVYECYDDSMDRRAAVKVLTFNAGDSNDLKKERSERFNREAKVLAKIDHENVVRVYDCGDSPIGSYIAMELVNGTSLDKLLASAGPMSLDAATNLVKQVLSALEVVHGHGIIHRDLKPPNLIIVGKTRVKVIDFGIASLPNSTPITRIGFAMGTANYMSPEQARGEATDTRSDLFSVGVILYELLTGVQPFVGTNPLAVCHAVIQSSPNFDGLAGNVASFLRKALNKGRDERFQSAKEMRSSLSSLTSNSARQTTSAKQSPQQTPPTPRPIPNHRAAAQQIILTPPSPAIRPALVQAKPPMASPRLSPANPIASHDLNWNLCIWVCGIVLLLAIVGGVLRPLFLLLIAGLAVWIFSKRNVRALAIVPIAALLGACILIPLRDSLIPKPLPVSPASPNMPSDPKTNPEVSPKSKSPSEGATKPNRPSNHSVRSKPGDGHNLSPQKVASEKTARKENQVSASKPPQKRVPAKQPAQDETPTGLRDGSRLGKDSDSDDGSDDVSGLRSGSRLGSG